MNLFPSAARRTALLPLLGLLLLSSCDKLEETLDSKPVLPPATQLGRDTFGCLLDDKVWVPSRKSAIDDILEAQLAPEGKGFVLKAEDNQAGANFYLRVSDPAQIHPGTYPLGRGFQASYEVWRNGRLEEYSAGTADQGTITITRFDRTTKTTTVQGQPVTETSGIVSGTFEFTAVNGSGQAITVREGRFDVFANE